MNKFKNINFDASKRKINNWIRNVNSNTIQVGIKKQPEIESEIMSSELLISEASSLDSNNDIMKILQKRRKHILKSVPKKPNIPKPKPPPKPASPLVFLNIDKFKNKSFIETAVVVRKPNKIIKQTVKTQKQLIKPTPIKPISHKKNIQKPKNTKLYKEKIYKINTKVKLNRNNKKCLEDTNRFSLNDIKQNLKNKNINISNKAPEKLTRDLYMICNIHI